jgi:hypothetical protein
MKRIFAALGITLAASGPTSGADLPDLIFQSSYEDIEACVVFDGLGDAVIIPTVDIRGSFTLNGQGFPLSEYDDANFSLRDRVTGDVFQIGNSHDETYSITVIPGRYDVLYSVETPGQFVPRNVGGVIMEDVELAADGILDIDVTAHLLSGDFLHNGVAFPASQYDDANIYLDGELTGRALLGNTHDQSYAAVPVLPGSYQIRYELETPGAATPWNEWGLVGTVEVVGTANQDVNVQSVELSGSFTHKGSPMPASQYDDGNFYLETESGDRVFLENSHNGGYQKYVIDGNYAIYWELETPGGTVPFNTRARLGNNVPIGAGKLDINIDSYSVTGDFTLNGNPFPASLQHRAQILFRDQVTGTDNVLAGTDEGGYTHWVVRGAYDIVYKHVEGDQVPENKEAVLGSVVIKNPAVVDVAVEGRLFGAPVYHNGILFPNDPQQIANIWLRNPGNPDRVQLGRVAQQNVSALVIPGTYDVYYGYLAGDAIPLNTMARILQGVVVDPPGGVILGEGLQFDVNSTLIAGQMYVNDVSPPASQYDDGLIELRRQDDSVLLGNTHDQSYQARVIKDPAWSLFDLHYSVETIGDTLPRNGDAKLGCMLLEPIVF